MTSADRIQLEAERRDRILALPTWTLIRVGWETKPGTVQGAVHYRFGDGLGPTGRDASPADVLRRVVQASHLPLQRQQWGIQILARPDQDGESS